MVMVEPMSAEKPLSEVSQEFLEFIVKTSSQYDETTQELAASLLRLRARERKLVDLCEQAMTWVFEGTRLHAELRAAIEENDDGK